MSVVVKLHPGQAYPHGILASHQHSHGYDSVYEELQPVVRVLREHHNMSLQEVSGTHRLLAASHGMHTEMLGWTDQAAVIRLRYGAGRLIVVKGKREEEILHLDGGDWAYLPAGVRFSMEGMVISGMNLQFHVGAVQPA